MTDQGSKASPRRARGRLASNRARGENANETQRPLSDSLRNGQGHLDLLDSILTSSRAHRTYIKERPVGHLSHSPEQHEHLPGGGLRSTGRPRECNSDPVTNDGPRFHSNMPISELTEGDTRAIEASVVSSAPLVAKTKDGVTHEIWPTPTNPHGARGLEPLDPKSGDQGSKVGPWRD